MISIGIPTYNYNVYPLVREIDKQTGKLGIDYEILVYDDASSLDYNLKDTLKEFKHVRYEVSPKNEGRIKTRRKIAMDARFDNILFLDADVFPADRFFMSKLIKTMTEKAEVYFGGIKVAPQCSDSSKILRWKYGKYRENITVEQRQKKPYLSIISGALLIKKDVFLADTENMKDLNRYGLDSFFTYHLKKNKRSVIHYSNPVIHLGLEKNEVFLDKTQKALETYHYLTTKFQTEPLNKLVNTYEKIKIIPKNVFRSLFKISAPFFKKNLLSKNPSLFIFDIYRLLYYAQL